MVLVIQVRILVPKPRRDTCVRRGTCVSRSLTMETQHDGARPSSATGHLRVGGGGTKRSGPPQSRAIRLQVRSSGFHPDQAGSIPAWRAGRELVWSFSARLKSERTSFDSTAADRVPSENAHCHVSPLAWTAACQAVSRRDRNPHVAPCLTHLLSSDGSERCLVCSACGFDFRRELFARGGAPRPRRRKGSTRLRFGGRGVVERPRRKGECSRQEQLRARDVQRQHAGLPNRTSRFDSESAHSRTTGVLAAHRRAKADERVRFSRGALRRPHRWTVPSLRNSGRRIVTSWGCNCSRRWNGSVPPKRACSGSNPDGSAAGMEQ